MPRPSLLVLVAALVLWTAPPAAAEAPAAATMSLSSQDVTAGGIVPDQQVYGDCNGDNLSPELHWSGAPAATKSFAVTLFDPDARGGGWWHWIVFGIPADSNSLRLGAGDPQQTLLPGAATQATNDFGHVGYSGPCPPAGGGPHHYVFTVWALDSANAPFGIDATGASVRPWLKAHALAKAELIARYSR